jgi:NitT/TauT family transport system ATP-binding protein
MATVKVDHLRKVFATPTGEVTVLNDISFTVESNTFASVIGPSGCGKTTLLNIIAGIEPKTSGLIEMTEEGRPAKLAYVFQEARLLPWRSVFDNLMYVQESRDAAAKERVNAALELVGLEDSAKKWPGQLSGGQQQRIGIARAFSVEPDLLLMDEPFSHLDAITARGLRDHLQELWQRTRKTVVFVTHDVSEAVELSDRIIMLSSGGKIHEDIPVGLPRPRRASNPDVAVMEADVLGRFEDLEMRMKHEATARRERAVV